MINMMPYMMDTSGAFGSYINHLEERRQILEAIAKGENPYVGDYYSWTEIEELEEALFEDYGIHKDLSFLHS
jgi:ABC-type glycerol-3-phosphate transport system substrate-binding protein